MANLTQQHIEYLEVFFAEQALALRERITLQDYNDADELAMLESDIRSLLAVEITDVASAKRALGVTDDRDSMIARIEEDDNAVGHSFLDTLYPA